jgi:hypothetical protein
MGRWQPYIYSPDERDLMEDFNPKAITMASRQPPPSPKQRPDGPLIDFNKHPDSYLVMPYGKTDVEPMNPKTKLYVKIARGLQLFLRLCSLLGAVGLLLCTIFIRGAQDTEGWLMRIPVSGLPLPRTYMQQRADKDSLASTWSSVCTPSTISSAVQARGPQLARPATISLL